MLWRRRRVSRYLDSSTLFARFRQSVHRACRIKRAQVAASAEMFSVDEILRRRVMPVGAFNRPGTANQAETGLDLREICTLALRQPFCGKAIAAQIPGIEFDIAPPRCLRLQPDGLYGTFGLLDAKQFDV